MVIIRVEDRVVDRSLTRKREKINLGPLFLTRDCMYGHRRVGMIRFGAF